MFFSYDIDGKMNPATGLSSSQKSEALDAIDTTLNLNETVLKTQRERLISELNGEDYKEMTVEEIFNVAGQFKSLIEEYAS